METIERIIEDYQRADIERRLHLYLNNRDLRPHFEEIDRSDLKDSAEEAHNISLREMSRGLGRGIMARLSTCCQNKSIHGS